MPVQRSPKKPSSAGDLLVSPISPGINTPPESTIGGASAKPSVLGGPPVSPITAKHNSSAIKASLALEQQSRKHPSSHRTRTSTKNGETISHAIASTSAASVKPQGKTGVCDPVHQAEANMSIVEHESSYLSAGDSDPWAVVENPKLNKKRSGDTETPNEHDNKKSKTTQESQDMSVFIKGKNSNICKYATQHCTTFKKDFDTQFGKPGNIFFIYKNECLKVICQNAKQKESILINNKIGLFEVVSSRPYAELKKQQLNSTTLTNTSQQAETQYKRVAFGFPQELSEDDIREETMASKVIRFKKGNGEVTPVTLLIFTSEPAEIVYIGYTPFKLKPYIPQPLRCDNCQRFGHKTSNCNGPTRCSFCSGSHKYTDCPKNKQIDKPKCSNCGQEHSAAFKGCSTYTLRKQALVVKVKNNVTFKDAIAEVKNKEQTNLATSTIVTEQQTEQQTDNGGFKIPQTPAHKTQNAWNTSKTPNNAVEIHQILLLLIQSTLLLLSKIGGDDVAPIVTTLTSFTTLLQKHT